MDIVAGLLMLLYILGLCSYSYISPDFHLTSRTYIQLAVGGIGSFYLLVFKNIGYIKGLFKNKKKDLNLKLDEVVNMNEQERAFEDFKALMYLKSRSLEIKSQEAFDLVVKLNNLFFSDTGEDTDEKQEE